ncbi:hypothetical protein KJK32_04970 [Streptomyces sp. JCM17656]|nr:hypothetical protein KJK32_04970 [Streptomyces sp. JCM17656]
MTTVLGVAGRSWRPALFVTGVSVATPLATLELAFGLTEAAGYRATASLPDIIAALEKPTAVTPTIVLPAVLLIIASVSATIGWAGGVWALVTHSVTGRPVALKDAYRYGLSRLRSLWPWTLAATLLFLAGLHAYVAPGIYLLFALSMFSFTVLFELGRHPLVHSFALTHRRLGRALVRWGTLAAVTIAFEAALSLAFATLSVVLLGYPGYGAQAHGIASTLIDTVHTAVGAPTWALLVVGLSVTHADLHNSERT